MDFNFDNRQSDSPAVDWLWQTHSDRAGSFVSTAKNHWEMVVTTYQGQTTLSIRGPETTAAPVNYPAEAEFFGIVFKHGAFMPHLPAVNLLTRQDEVLAAAAGKGFWLHGSTWEIPTFENADTFIERLVKNDLLALEPVVEAVLENRPLDLSPRTIQRRFLRATGLTQGTFVQIDRAQQAVALLEKGLTIADAVFQAGYADQPHLTRSLKRFTGRTPAQILRLNQPE
jgi:AraC-like DNA-binding protein